MKNNKGITLIALVITIIVMLILVGVTISMAVNGGLFEYAGNAVRQTNTKLQEEEKLADGGVKVGDKWYNSIDEYLVSSGNKENGGKPGEEDDTPAGNGITAGAMQSNLRTYLGQKIAYGVEYDDKSTYGNKEWEIFYADGAHIYIITRGHLANGALVTTNYNGTDDFTTANLSTKYPAVAAGLLNKTYDPTAAGTVADPYLKYPSTKTNMKATQYLLDSTVELWANLVNNEYADWAIGGPTLELFVNSFNVYYPDKAVTLNIPTGNGYACPLSASNSVPSGTYLNHSTNTSYWLASMSNNFDNWVRGVYAFDSNVSGYSCNNSLSFRPVVCLSSDVQIKWDEATSAYTISSTSAT